jgi:hypothetical protein
MSKRKGFAGKSPLIDQDDLPYSSTENTLNTMDTPQANRTNSSNSSHPNSENTNTAACILCHKRRLEHYYQDRRREYLRCLHCDLVQVPSIFWLTPEQEKAEYDFHQNHFGDAGYEGFLMRCAQPLLERLSDSATGLDFGCGPAPVLCSLFEAQGHPMCYYDLYYWPDTSPLQGQYDFITATEVIEHISNPKPVFELWMQMLKPAGYLAIMTKRVSSLTAFQRWHYKNDPTHIAFYSEKTFEYLAMTYSLQLTLIGADVVFLKTGV